MSDLSKATPRPWCQASTHVFKSGEGNANICTVSEPHSGTLVRYNELRHSSPDFGEAIANAALIVRAVNAHDDLVATLRHMRALYKSLVGPDDRIANAMLEECDAALAKAEGRAP